MNLFAQSFIQTIQDSTLHSPTLIHQGITQGYCSKISTQDNHFYFCSDERFLQILSEAMLLENHPSKEDMQDLSKELANLVIGHAKVLYAQHHIPLQIGTPSFLGETLPQTHHLEGIHFALGEGKCSMYKESIC